MCSLDMGSKPASLCGLLDSLDSRAYTAADMTSCLGQQDMTPKAVTRLIKRLCVTFIAFLVAGAIVAIFRENIPTNVATGAVMAAIAYGLVWGTWRWSVRFK